MQSEQTTLRLTFLGVKQHGNTFHPTSEVDIACVKTPHPSPQEKSENVVCAQAKVDIRVFLLYFFNHSPLGGYLTDTQNVLFLWGAPTVSTSRVAT